RAMTTWPDFRGNSSRRCWLAERRDVGTDYNAVTRRGYARSIHLVSLRLYSFVPKTLVPLRKKSPRWRLTHIRCYAVGRFGGSSPPKNSFSAHPWRLCRHGCAEKKLHGGRRPPHPR